MFPSTLRIEDPSGFLTLAVEYHITGRFAAINSLSVAPNLMRHAVEMLTKFTLLKDIDKALLSTATAQLGKNTDIGSRHYGVDTSSP